jgi:hypothetical protein
MKRTSTSVLRFGSCCQSALMSHVSTSREGFPREHAPPVTGAPVVTALEPAPADTRLDHCVHCLCLADFVGGERPPSAHFLGEYAPRHILRRLHKHDLAQTVRLVTFSCCSIVHDNFLLDFFVFSFLSSSRLLERSEGFIPEGVESTFRSASRPWRSTP